VITVNESVLKWVQFVSIMLYVLVAGVMWGTWLSLARTMTNYDAATFLTDGKHMIENLATIMAVLMISAVVIGIVVVVLLFRSRSTVAAWLATIGLLLHDRGAGDHRGCRGADRQLDRDLDRSHTAQRLAGDPSTLVGISHRAHLAVTGCGSRSCRCRTHYTYGRASKIATTGRGIRSASSGNRSADE
jgi:hypothetical protein